VYSIKIINKLEEDYSSIEKDVIKVLEKMPKWKPAKCNNKNIAFLYKLPIYF
jgi:hypothetical protein